MTSLLPFRTHIVALLVLAVAGAVHHHVVGTTHHRRLAFFSLLSLAVVIAWPVGDLAASVSVTVATVQRLVIMLLVAPLALLSLSTKELARLTRPAPIDTIVRWVTHPGVAIALVTVVGTATLSSPAINWGARSSLGRDVVLLLVVSIGVVLWIPALGVVPGTRHLSPTGQAGYLFASSLVVTSLSFVWIFSHHPLYSGLHHQYALLHMTPLFDQQLAGFVAKFGAYIPMWAVAVTIFSRAEHQGIAVEETPLYWADVERAMLRADRQLARENRRRRQV